MSAGKPSFVWFICLFVYAHLYCRKLAGDNNLQFVEALALKPPEAQIDINEMARYQAELDAAAAAPLPDDDDDL